MSCSCSINFWFFSFLVLSDNFLMCLIFSSIALYFLMLGLLLLEMDLLGDLLLGF
jgi:hypothetical protein